MDSEASGDKITFYVAQDGSDANDGTEMKPFATLEHAQDRVRQSINQGLDKDIVVMVREGTYYLSEGLTFGPEDSGNEDYSIKYMAYPGEKVCLIGGREITDWKSYRGEIWEASMASNDVPLQIFENNVRLNLARTPEEGYFHLESAVDGKERTDFIYKADDLKPDGWDISDASVFIWPNHDWSSATKPVAEMDTENRVIKLGNDSGGPMKTGNRYFIQNVLALLDTPGECQINSKQGKIYVWPRKSPIAEQTIVASTAENVISIEGRGTDRIVRNLHFEGLDLCISNGDVVSIKGAEDCSFRFCKMENGHDNGVSINRHAQRISIYGNLIQFNDMHGVALSGFGPGQPDVNKYNVVENNHIYHCGRLVGHGYGVMITQSGHNKVIHNHIHNMPRYAATIKGPRYQILREQIEGVTWENRHDFHYSHDNLIAYNHIHHVNEDSQDTGALESWGPGRDNVYDHNLIHDVGNEHFNLQMGIYLDDATDYFTVTNNIIWGVVGTNRTQSIYAKGIGNKISNNIFIIGEKNTAAISSLYMAEERADNHIYTHNIYYFEGEEGVIYDFYNWSDDRVAMSDYNVFWKPKGELVMGGKSPGKALDEWCEILNKKFDQHSIVADPMFVDRDNHNYHLNPDSPALKLGFKDIDTSKIGLKEDFPERFER